VGGFGHKLGTVWLKDVGGEWRACFDVEHDGDHDIMLVIDGEEFEEHDLYDEDSALGKLVGEMKTRDDKNDEKNDEIRRD